MSPRLRSIHVVFSAWAWAWNTSLLVNSPPSVPTRARTSPPAATTVAVCQSAWTYDSRPCAVVPEMSSRFGDQCATSSQVGCAAVPSSVRAPHSEPPMITWSGFVGLTAIAWSYQVCGNASARSAQSPGNEPPLPSGNGSVGLASVPVASTHVRPPSSERHSPTGSNRSTPPTIA